MYVADRSPLAPKLAELIRPDDCERIGQMIGCSPEIVERFRTGAAHPCPRLQQKLAAALGISMSELWQWAEDF